MQIDPRLVADLAPYARNSRTHSEAQVQQIAASIREFGWTQPVLADAESIVVGHGRVLGAALLYSLGETIYALPGPPRDGRPGGAALPAGSVPVIDCTGWSEDQRRAYVIADNQIALNAGWDLDVLRSELLDLGQEIDLELLGFDDDSLKDFLSPADPDPQEKPPVASMADKFGIPPFTVMNAREGWWQERKRAWLARGIQSELGRGDNLLGISLTSTLRMMTSDPAKHQAIIAQGREQGMSDGEIVVLAARTWGVSVPVGFSAGPEKAAPGGGKMPSTNYSNDGARGDSRGRAVGAATSFDSQDKMKSIMDQRKPKKGLGATPSALGRAGPGGDAEAAMTTGTSIFDPVLCELSYRWFCPPGGTVLDPFAGGSVRGLVAAWLGLTYFGGDLSGRQIEANREQAERLIENDTAPVWVQGDSRTLEDNLTAAGIEDQADMIMTCPPYADLEVYSDDPADLSNMPYPDFIAGYREALAQACGRLKNNRFAVVVVGEVRDPKGNYRNFVGDTVEAMRAAGMHFYNEAILITMVGSLPIRAGKQFAAGRKLGKTHQNVLVFVKGDGKAATQACGPVEFAASLEAGPEPDLEPV